MIIGAFGVIAFKDIKKIAAYQVILSIGFIILGLGSIHLLEFMVLFLSNKRYCSKNIIILYYW